MVKKFIGIQEPGYEQFGIKIGDMNVHETEGHGVSIMQRPGT